MQKDRSPNASYSDTYEMHGYTVVLSCRYDRDAAERKIAVDGPWVAEIIGTRHVVRAKTDIQAYMRSLYKTWRLHELDNLRRAVAECRARRLCKGGFAKKSV